MPIEFEDFEVEISRCLCGRAEVRILQSPFDRPRERFDPPFDLDELNNHLNQLDEFILASDRRRYRLAEEIGLKLFAAVFPKRIGTTFGKSLAAVETRGGLRIRLSFGESQDYLPEVIGLPWELICDPETRQFPASEPKSPLVRYLDLSKRIRPLKVRPPIKVLAVLSSPEDRDLPPVDVERHGEILSEAVAGRGSLQIHTLDQPTLAALRSELTLHKRQGRPFHVLHFLGHGDFNDDGEGELYFEREDRSSDRVTGQKLAMVLAGFDELRLAVLNTCVGARMLRRRGQHPFTGAASALIGRGLPAVVAMQFPFSESAALQFTSKFYEKLSYGHPVDEAVTEGRLGIAANERDSFEWASPVIFLRSQDGKILDLQPTLSEEPVPPRVDTLFKAEEVFSAEDLLVAGKDEQVPLSASGVDAVAESVCLQVELGQARGRNIEIVGVKRTKK